MKRFKRLNIFVLSFIMIFICCINSFAAPVNNVYSFVQIPSDLGNQLSYVGAIDNAIHKYYMVLRVGDITTSTYMRLWYYQYDNNGNETSTVQNIYIDTEHIYIESAMARSYDTSFFFLPKFDISSDYYGQLLYIPIYTRNANINGLPHNDNVTVLFYASTSDSNTVASEAFTLGYNTGYEIGYDDGFDTAANVVADLPLVEKLSTFIASFTGEDTASYITPLAICMILILIYCLFIRWILNLARSSKLTRLTDIVVLVSCIAILLIYYIPMIDFTINQNQTVENIYRVINDVNVGG